MDDLARKSQPSIQKQRTHWAYIEPTVLFPFNQLCTMNCHPDIFTLLLT
jgi:hypothetical protein